MGSKRIVIDTNVYLSALLFGGNPRKVVELAFLEGHSVVISEEIFTEMRRVISKKFPSFINEYITFESFIQSNAILVGLGSIQVNVCRDSKDNMVIETAIIGGCDYIITGDNDLLALQKFDEILITTPAQIIAGRVLE